MILVPNAVCQNNCISIFVHFDGFDLIQTVFVEFHGKTAVCIRTTQFHRLMQRRALPSD